VNLFSTLRAADNLPLTNRDAENRINLNTARKEMWGKILPILPKLNLGSTYIRTYNTERMIIARQHTIYPIHPQSVIPAEAGIQRGREGARGNCELTTHN